VAPPGEAHERLANHLGGDPASAVYLGLIGLDVYLLTKTARTGLHQTDAQLVSAPAPGR
jgi:cytochrome d ubiquinol oxidase subunit I